VEDAIRQTLADAVTFLATNSVPFAVIGGIAVSVRGEPRFTADVDFVIGVDIDRGLELLSAVKGSAFAPLFSGVDEVVRTSFLLPLRHLRTRVKVDLAIGLTGFERQLIKRSHQEDLGGVSAPVATAEDLLLMKVLAGRPRDAEDGRSIALKQGPKLDWDYVLETGKALQDAVGQDLVPQLKALMRQSSPESK